MWKVGVVWIGLLLLGPWACGDNSGDGAGGASAACLEFEACGGDVEGDWTVDAVCFENPEVIFEGLVPGDECDGWLLDLGASADGSRSYDGSSGVEATLMLTLDLETFWSRDCIRARLGPDAPINSRGCASWENGLTSDTTSASCVLREGANDGCDCLITREDMSMGSGNYALAGDMLTEDGDRIPHCIEGDRLVLSIEREGLIGNIVLSRD